MTAALPLRLSPDTVTVMPFATFLLAKVPVAPLVTSVTLPASPDNTPLRDAPLVLSVTVVGRHTLLLAVIPVTVNVAWCTACVSAEEVLPVKLESPP